MECRAFAEDEPVSTRGCWMRAGRRGVNRAGLDKSLFSGDQRSLPVTTLSVTTLSVTILSDTILSVTTLSLSLHWH